MLKKKKKHKKERVNQGHRFIFASIFIEVLLSIPRVLIKSLCNLNFNFKNKIVKRFIFKNIVIHLAFHTVALYH